MSNREIGIGLFGLIVGAAAGALIGILIAPNKGSRTRKKIARQVKNSTQEITDTIGEKVDDVKDKLNDVVDEMRKKANQAEEKIKEKIR